MQPPGNSPPSDAPTTRGDDEQAVRTTDIGGWLKASGSSMVGPTLVYKSSSGAPAPASGEGGRYLREQVLGKGGMGEVLLVKDLMIGREVAMKIILPQHRDNTDVSARFLTEAQVQGQLEHPSIVPVHDLGMLTDGTAFFTMKRLRGQTLQDVLHGLRKGIPEVTSAYSRHRLLVVFSAVCMAIDFAHSFGVLHRDIKPANIMLGDFGEVYVLDWGLAKVQTDPTTSAAQGAAKQEISGNVGLTQPGHIMGTLGYVAPEQAGELAEPVDARADVFSLGAVLFEILTLQPLRQAEPPMQMLFHIREGVEARPSVRAPEREVPPELEAACMRATRQRPQDRYPSARALHDVVHGFLSGNRDLELRREIAARYLGEAEEAVQQLAQSPDADSQVRRKALQAVGRVLALDPDNQQASSLLQKTFASPPPQVPKEVEQRLRADNGQRDLAQISMGLRAETVSALLLPLVILMGVRNWRLFWIIMIIFPIGVLLRIWILRLPVGTRMWHVVRYVGHFHILVMFAWMGGIYGPLFFFTGPAILHCVTNAASRDRRYRKVVIISTALLTLVMLLVEVCGVIPRSYAFHDGQMIILPRIVELPETISLFLLACINLVCILMPSQQIARETDRQAELQKQILMNEWQLKHLVPDSQQWHASHRAERTPAVG